MWKILNRLAETCLEISSEAYNYHIKKNKYEQIVIDVEKARYFPLVFACFADAGPKALKQEVSSSAFGTQKHLGGAKLLMLQWEFLNKGDC